MHVKYFQSETTTQKIFSSTPQNWNSLSTGNKVAFIEFGCFAAIMVLIALARVIKNKLAYKCLCSKQHNNITGNVRHRLDSNINAQGIFTLPRPSIQVEVSTVDQLSAQPQPQLRQVQSTSFRANVAPTAPALIGPDLPPTYDEVYEINQLSPGGQETPQLDELDCPPPSYLNAAYANYQKIEEKDDK